MMLTPDTTFAIPWPRFVNHEKRKTIRQNTETQTERGAGVPDLKRAEDLGPQNFIGSQERGTNDKALRLSHTAKRN